MAEYLFTIAVLVADYLFVPFALKHLEEQQDQAGLIVIALLLGAVNVAVVAAWCHMLAAKRKGSLRIRFVDRVYNHGEEVAGELVLVLLRPVVAKYLRVSLVATAHRPSDERSSSWTVWRQEIDLLGEGKVSPGTKGFPFTFKLPSSISESSPTVVERLMTQMVRGSLSWRLEAELDLEGANLKDTQQVRVNDGDLF